MGVESRENISLIVVRSSSVRQRSKFDSGNLARVEPVVPVKKGKANESPDYEFNLWTRVDAADTEFKNSYRSWFYFSVKGIKQSVVIKCNIKNLNKHSKVFTDHMYPVFMVSGHNRWQRIRDKPSFLDAGENAVLTFTHRIESMQKVYFALCYPYPYRDIINFLDRIDHKYSSINKTNFSSEDIYYYRECLCHSLEGRSIDLITITSTWGISREREPRFQNLFPNTCVPRPHRFPHKKVIFLSARVHPAETSSSFVLDGVITSLLNKEDPGAAMLRRKFIFKLIPVLNPDGVVRGHYRTDTRGTNLNRVYGQPSSELHPSIYAACTLIRYYHGGCANGDALLTENEGELVGEESEILLDGEIPCPQEDKVSGRRRDVEPYSSEIRNSGLFLYLDLHSHASRKGFFLYGNNFPQPEDCIEVRVFAKLMEINCKGFLYNSCDFSEASMHLKDKSGNGSREGAGRVWVTKETGLVYSYTFEAHYNTGQVETCIPRRISRLESKHWISYSPSDYSTPTYEGVGRAILQSILDLNGPNTWSRVTSSSLKSLSKIRDAVQKELCCRITRRKPLPVLFKPAVRLAAINSFKNPTASTVTSNCVSSKVLVPPTERSLQGIKRNKLKDLPKESKSWHNLHPKLVPRLENHKPPAVKPVAVKPTAIKPTASKPTAVKPMTIKSTNMKPIAIKLAASIPTALQPVKNEETGTDKKKRNTLEQSLVQVNTLLKTGELLPDDSNQEDSKLCCPPF